MAFSKALKAKVRRRADFNCCLCHTLGVEVHHIIPEGEGGPDTEDNAAPLCPTCHDVYGANLEKRKFIREARDCWYEVCERRYRSSHQLGEILETMRSLASKTDLKKLKTDLLTGLPFTAGSKSRLAKGGVSLGDVIGFYYNSKSPRPTSKDVSFVFDQIFCYPLSEDADSVRTGFIEEFGRETARMILRHAMKANKFDLRGFTEEELNSTCSLTITTMILLLLHEDFGKYGKAIRFQYAPNGKDFVYQCIGINLTKPRNTPRITSKRNR